MSEAWKKIDLEGGGLQAANVQLARMQKKARLAYMLLVLFPFGLHRFYLKDVRGGVAYITLTAITVLLALYAPLWSIALPVVLAVFGALADIRWIDDQTTQLNKRLRMQIFFRQTGGAPKGYQGRYVDEAMDLDSYIRAKESERGGHQPFDNQATQPGTGSRVLSFNQQEAMLREIAKRKKESGTDGSQGGAG